MARSTFSGPVNSVAGFQIAGVAIGATAAEINVRNDDSAMSETIIAAGAVSATVAETSLALVGAGAVTLAVPTKPGLIKIITMTVDNGDVTMALTNVVGGSAATTCTFNDANDLIVLVSDLARAKWVVLKEVGVVLS
ncbi:hypothetical protein UFOVP1437_62 [uncultured Caudovirales phage]|uniref:Uncharacterized protein n=1 Tax=uncultured Caudovirales phage TaxID=2100421 RepID=A0A6J5SFM7_9CAUD|nr:hypothetical protein UFOVP1437_62 [uncultured Caudovirales phage]CAB5228109.1 hypothetical protein UFOVP1531_3 [uncultured Caudovirales phage]